MDFELSDEQRQMRDVMRAFTEEQITPVSIELEQAGTYPEKIVIGLAELGLFGMTVPTEYGGLGADLVTMTLVFEEISKGWMGVAGILGSHSLACKMIADHGTEEQRATRLPELARGERRTAIALTEPDAGSDLQGIATRAELDGDEYVVTGTKMWITNARHADPLPVLVKTDPTAVPPHRGMSVLLVPKDSPGMEVTRDLHKLGYRGPETCEVVLDQVRVHRKWLLGGVEGRGMQQVLSALEAGRLNIAARSVGIAQASLDDAVSYSSTREAFGQPIGNFQAVQMRLADMATRISAARVLTWWAADRAQRRRADMETGMAKYFASEVAIEAALECMRIHGSYGYSEELPVARRYRDAPLMAIGEGTNDILRTVIARHLAGGWAFEDE